MSLTVYFVRQPSEFDRERVRHASFAAITQGNAKRAPATRLFCQVELQAVKVTASWPIATELANRLRARDSAALATSVHLVCRPRPADAPIGDWADVLRELPKRVGDWIEKLQDEGIRGADLVFACIGPAMEIYSRYRRVEDAEGREIPLGGDPTAIEPYKRGFLAYVWETVGRLAVPSENSV
jgi:hypothetical protein